MIVYARIVQSYRFNRDTLISRDFSLNEKSIRNREQTVVPSEFIRKKHANRRFRKLCEHVSNVRWNYGRVINELF